MWYWIVCIFFWTGPLYLTCQIYMCGGFLFRIPFWYLKISSLLMLVICVCLFKKILFIYLFIWPHWVLVAACRTISCGLWTLSCDMWGLVPWPEMEPGPPVSGVWSPSHWATREVPCFPFLFCQSCWRLVNFRISKNQLFVVLIFLYCVSVVNFIEFCS